MYCISESRKVKFFSYCIITTAYTELDLEDGFLRMDSMWKHHQDKDLMLADKPLLQASQPSSLHSQPGYDYK